MDSPLRVILYDPNILDKNQPPQQLPGLPQLFGLPQQPPAGPGEKSGREAPVLCAERSLLRSWLSQDLQCNSSSLFKTRNSFTSPHLSHLYS
jgi:hypothetical protein